MCVLSLAFSLLMYHPFFAVSVRRLSLSLSRLSRPHVLAVLTCPTSAGQAHLRTRTRSLAIWPSPSSTQVLSPTSSARSILWTMTRCSLTIQISMKSLTSQKHTLENIGLFGVPTIFESSASHVSHDDFALQMESKEGMHRETDCQTERKEREGSVISVAESMSKKSRRYNIRSHCLQTLRKFYSDGWDLREHLQRRARQAILGENSDQRRLYLPEYNTDIQDLERRNSEYALTDLHRERLNFKRQQLLEANQSKLDVREYSCVATWRWRIVFIKNAMQEVAEKLKNVWKTLLSRENTEKNERDWKNFLPSMIRNQEQWVYSSTILIHWAVMTYLRSSSSYYLEFKKSQPRSWNAARYTRGYEYSWKRFWFSTCSTTSWRITQWLKKFGNTIGKRWWCRRFWEKKELRTVGAKNCCNQYLYLAFQ